MTLVRNDISSTITVALVRDFWCVINAQIMLPSKPNFKSFSDLPADFFYLLWELSYWHFLGPHRQEPPARWFVSTSVKPPDTTPIQRQAPNLSCKYQTRVEVYNTDQHSILLCYGINHDCKTFYDTYVTYFDVITAQSV